MKAFFHKHPAESLSDSQLNEHSKTKTHSSTYPEKFYNILQHHPNHLYVFTDGSKDNGRAACVAVLNKRALKKALRSKSPCNRSSSQHHLEE